MPVLAISRITLRRLILSLSMGSVLIMLILGGTGIYGIQRTQLMDDTLASNQAFAQKLAASASDFLTQAQNDLAYSAKQIAQFGTNPAVMQMEANHLHLQGAKFHSVSITSAQGIILAISPETLQISGRKVPAVDPQTAVLRKKTPTISKPFTTILGNLAILLTHPLYSPQNEYLGYLAGTVYLKADGGLSRLIKQHYFRNDTYVYLVDSSRRLLYHPDPNRLGTIVGTNPVVTAVLSGQTGAERITNSQGVDMLAGYAYIPGAKWGVVVQRPTEVTLGKLSTLMQRVMWLSLLPVLLLLAALWFLSTWISRPLRALSHIMQTGYDGNAAERIRSVRCWYSEAQHLQKALLAGTDTVISRLSQLREEAYQDPLTGLGNRRGLDIALQALESTGQPFSVLALDIDFFKRINDHYGHDVGDQVIRQMGELMRSQARNGDSLFRMGGEEFLTLLPGTPVDNALTIAERLRAAVEASPLLPQERVTISIGIAAWGPDSARRVADTLKEADLALYQAKQNGRNRVERSA
ncbi:MAG: sensor domain-containing diguanylate cyclase [Castellaniella sp.]